MSLTKQKTVAAVTLAILVAIGTGVLARQAPEDRKPDASPGSDRVSDSEKTKPEPDRDESPSKPDRGGQEKVTTTREENVRSEPDRDRQESGKEQKKAVRDIEPREDAEG